jgi:hypothetical protein
MRRRARSNPSTSTVVIVVGVLGAAGVGLYLWRRQSLQTQVSTLNAKCVANRALAQEAQTATPARAAAIRAQVEQTQGQAFLSDFEWTQWIASQSIASCSAFVQ